MIVQPNKEQLIGQSQSHLEEVFSGYFLHCGVVEAYLQLLEQAAEEGIVLRLASGFRSFERQLTIWNAKAQGEQSVIGSEGEPVVMGAMSERDQVFAILRWSALPGASRHHWGTDMDIWDSARVGNDYQLQLVQREYNLGGPFYHCSCWLDELISNGETEFFRPYNNTNTGVAAEPWHLSFRPVANVFEKALGRDMLHNLIENTDICLKDAILDNFDEIYSRFVCLQY